ncbi:helix-turn-helix transcriptional regulator [Limimaricola variabilis]|uniref:helix-turn-helix transcriptional regulator n=1 Tax=Limimaricola variabilis TaxID=1492771 RepID=UPI002AC91E10|nr:helix-turn-helix transcriptional regulator [Limimaricola variabilis]WPY95208.1 helix-turn-helix transcriptional regulator [Limimaricola variabilis]
MSRILIFAAAAAGLFGLLVVLEALQADEPFTWAGFAIDLFETALLAGAVVFTAFGSQASREMRRERARLLGDLDRARREGEQWRQASRAHVDGLSRAIAAQFAQWELTETESEVALLMLKGLSHKEIATLRDCSSATVRQHATAVYRKSGLTSRSQLTGFFLEDLLAPLRARGGLHVVDDMHAQGDDGPGR